MQKHNTYIDVLRFLAAMIVVLFHQNAPLPHVANWYRELVSYGNLGVPIFFTISGYCIKIAAGNAENPMAFMTRRLFRIFPPYWFSLLVVMLAVCFQHFFKGGNSIPNIPRNPEQILATIFLLTSPVTNVIPINWVYWTLTCELFFYLLVTITLIEKEMTNFGLIIISLVALFLHSEPSGIFFLWSRWPAFGLGVSLYYLAWEKQRGGERWIGLVLCLVNMLGLVQQTGWTLYLRSYTSVRLALQQLLPPWQPWIFLLFRPPFLFSLSNPCSHRNIHARTRFICSDYASAV